MECLFSGFEFAENLCFSFLITQGLDRIVEICHSNALLQNDLFCGIH